MSVDTYQRTVEVSLDPNLPHEQVPDENEGGRTCCDKTDDCDDRFVGYGRHVGLWLRCTMDTGEYFSSSVANSGVIVYGFSYSGEILIKCDRGGSEMKASCFTCLPGHISISDASACTALRLFLG